MEKSSNNTTEAELSLTKMVNRLRQAGLSDDKIDVLLANMNSNAHDENAIFEHNKRVDETVDVTTWQMKIGATCVVLGMILIGQFLFRSNTSKEELEITLVIFFILVLIALLTNIKVIPVYLRNARYFLKK